MILIDQVEFIPLYNPPHFLKCMRNNFLNKDIEIDFDAPNLQEKDRKIPSWEHLIKAYEIDVHSDFLDRHVPKYTEQHVYPDKIKKMKIKLMMQVFSKKGVGFTEILAKSKLLLTYFSNFVFMEIFYTPILFRFLNFIVRFSKTIKKLGFQHSN